MKTIKTYILVILFAAISHLILAQAPVKQYCGGTNGSVSTPAHALGTDLSNYSLLKLRTPNAAKDNVYQNFVFAPEATKGTRVAFVIQTDAVVEVNKVFIMNYKFYTTTSGTMSADTLDFIDVQITQLNASLNLYEFSFSTDKNFDTAGMMLTGNGLFNSAKIYKVYLAINTQRAPVAFVSAKR